MASLARKVGPIVKFTYNESTEMWFAVLNDDIVSFIFYLAAYIPLILTSFLDSPLYHYCCATSALEN